MKTNRTLRMVTTAFLLSCVQVSAETALPNVVLFLIDDLDWADLALTGSTCYATPNVDALAKEGGLFSDAYAANPACLLTRASIMTGK